MNGFRAAPVGDSDVFSEGGDLGDPVSVDDADHPESFSDSDGFWKERLDLFGAGARGHVIIFRQAPEQFIAHAPTGKERFVSIAAQHGNDFNCGITEI